MKIQRINKYYDFAVAKKLCKATALRQKQEHYIVSAKTQKQKMSEIDEDFYRQQLESAEMDKSLIDTITKFMESVYKEFLSYFA